MGRDVFNFEISGTDVVDVQRQVEALIEKLKEEWNAKPFTNGPQSTDKFPRTENPYTTPKDIPMGNTTSSSVPAVEQS